MAPFLYVGWGTEWQMSHVLLTKHDIGTHAANIFHTPSIQHAPDKKCKGFPKKTGILAGDNHTIAFIVSLVVQPKFLLPKSSLLSTGANVPVLNHEWSTPLEIQHEAQPKKNTPPVIKHSYG